MAFPSPRNGTRVVVHVHSDWSYDGSWKLSELATAFRRRGYRAILMAEHDYGFSPERWAAYRRACAEASSGEILLVPGIEYSDADNTIHVPVWGDVPFLGEELDTDEMLRAVADAGGLAVLAHPRRKNAWAKLDPAWLPYLIGIELWNRRYDGYAPSRRVAELLREHPRLLPFATLDFHTTRHFHPLAMVLELDGPVSEQSILDAIAHGRARPTAFRLPAQAFARGALWSVMRGIDRARRLGLNTVRRARGARRRRPSRTSKV
jgi:predicted metal-dependent phosphoesterase TrpH